MKNFKVVVHFPPPIFPVFPWMKEESCLFIKTALIIIGMTGEQEKWRNSVKAYLRYVSKMLLLPADKMSRIFSKNITSLMANYLLPWLSFSCVLSLLVFHSSVIFFPHFHPEGHRVFFLSHRSICIFTDMCKYIHVCMYRILMIINYICSTRLYILVICVSVHINLHENS